MHLLLPSDFYDPGFQARVITSYSIHYTKLYELNFSDSWLLTGALRFENYSDFGSTLNWKTSLRYKLNDNWALRGAASTGFRAPSLHQRYFSATSSVFTDVITSYSIHYTKLYEDIGDGDDLHPRNKQDVGFRLARNNFV